MDAGVRHEPLTAARGRLRPATGRERRQRSAMNTSRLAQELHLVVAREHDVNGARGQACRRQVRRR